MHRTRKNIALLCLFVSLLFCNLALADNENVLVLPSGLKVIKEDAFYGDTSITQVVLPEGITEIGANAFADSSLTSINLPSSLTSIGDGALPVPGTVKVSAEKDSWAYIWAVEHGYIVPTLLDEFVFEVIDDSACRITKYTGSSDTVIIPETDGEGRKVTAIGSYAFEECCTLTEIVLPDTLEELEDYAFVNCFNLRKVNIPSGIKTAGAYIGPFYGCSSLADVTIQDGLEVIPPYLFKFSAIKEIHIPESVKHIDSEAFAGCIYLEEVHFPSDLEIISSECFSYCTSLKKVDLPEGLRSLGSHVFEGCSLEEVTIPKDLEESYYSFSGCSALKTIHFSEGISNIPNALFYHSGLEVLILPESVREIKAEAFCQCENLREIRFNSGLQKIEYNAFSSCSALTEVTLPNTLEELGNGAFQNCINLAAINIPASIKKAGRFYPTFSGCSSLTDVTIEDGLEVIPANLFTYSGIKEIRIPESVKFIDQGAFYECECLEKIHFPTGLKSIGCDCFLGCTALKKVDLPEGLCNLGGYMSSDGWDTGSYNYDLGTVFTGCTALEEVTLPRNLEYDWDAFRFCPALKRIIMLYPSDLAVGRLLGYGNSGNVTYSSSNPDVARMYNSAYSDGVVATFGIGSATLTVSRDGNVISEYTLYVKDGRINSGSRIVSGILREGEGWKIRWQISYDEDRSGNEYNAQLYIYLDGSNPSDGSLMLYSLLDNGFLMPWLTDEYGFTRSSFNKITIIGGTSNSFEIISDTFSDYINVERVELTRVRIIQARAFENCTGLTSLTYDSTLTLIGNEAFKNCANLESISNRSYTSNLAVIGSEAFMNSGLTSIPSPESLETVGDRAFANTNISVVIFDQLTSLGDSVFDGCPDVQFYCYYHTKWLQCAIDNDLPFRILVDKQYETWGKATGTISALEYAKLNWYCTDASGNESREAMENEMYERLHDFPIGHPLHTDDDLRYRSLEREQIQAFRFNSDLQVIRITLDAETVIVIFAGTKDGQLGDLVQDADILMDVHPEVILIPIAGQFAVGASFSYWINMGTQIDSANTFVQQQIGFGYNVYVTGYSLGGYLAVDVTLKNSKVKECCAIDPPGRNTNDALLENLSGNADRITNYCNKDSTVSSVGKHVGKVNWVDVEDHWIKIGSVPAIHNHKIEKTIEALGGGGIGGW